MSQTILYRNHLGTVFLFDIPASIQDGQQATYTLRSSPALESPYSSTEPKGAKRGVAIAAIPIDDRVYHDTVQRDIYMALAEIRNHCLGGSWCRPRALISGTNPVLVPSVRTSESEGSVSTDVSLTAVPLILSTTELRNKFASLLDLQGNVICNLLSDLVIVELTDLGNFLVPPRSTFILATLEQGLPAFTSARKEFLPRNHDFDLILMDPPWSNRSVRHSHAYRTQEDQLEDPFEEAVRIVKGFLTPHGWVAVWITNKSSIRAKVLQDFQVLDLHLLEEWAWIKTTTGGEPVTQLDGIWRRPYEIFLLFRKGVSSEKPRRRIIAAVPDLHSRKPCLKMLLEELLPPNYSALELFARNLTAGWWSWGNEVLKFQHESQWACYEDC